MVAYTLFAMVGGALGTGLRAVINKSLALPSLLLLPLPTLVVNVVGSFLAGLFFFKLSPRNELYTFLNIGLCGGMTTMSSCVLESFLLIKQGHVKLGVVNATINLIASMVAVALGSRLANYF